MKFFAMESVGVLDTFEHRLGERVDWEKFPGIKGGGRPSGGSVVAPAWCQCPHCGASFDAAVDIVDDRFVGVRLLNERIVTE